MARGRGLCCLPPRAARSSYQGGATGVRGANASRCRGGPGPERGHSGPAAHGSRAGQGAAGQGASG
eukprot:3260462-Alexandrium_andersonii.AAC.1